MPVRSIQPQRMYEQIAAELTRLIRERDFHPGDRLPPERELAQQLGVSRPSVREAMIALETAGVIEVRTGSGTYVRSVVDEKFRLPGGHGARRYASSSTRASWSSRKSPRSPQPTRRRKRSRCSAAAVDRADAHFSNGERAEDDDYAFHTTLAAALAQHRARRARPASVGPAPSSDVGHGAQRAS